ncbi:MAG: glycosyltransferase, partial [Silicimonas sp.]|nr:glycosyltransferase [Silicimonas sp.]
MPDPKSIDLDRHPPDARALDRIGIENALRFGVLPLRSAGAITPVASPSLGRFRTAQRVLEAKLGPVACCLADRQKIEDQITRLRAPTLAVRATTRTAPVESCRNWSGARAATAAACLSVLLLLWAILWPVGLLWVVTGWAALTLVSVTGLRTVAAVVEARHARREQQTWTSRRPYQRVEASQPVVSLLVPLFDEEDIAKRLVKRLERLDYPRSRLDVLLILEANDMRTRKAIEDTDLPKWMRIITVPSGAVRTKPRALNFALDFAHGEIVGIYDAEDAPAADQLLRVVDTFRHAGPEVACVQGVLDFYNARQNWLTRCFTIDYATWFRLVLPGLVRLGFAIPLGGTTLFFRRDVLGLIGCWDAHNVTEDADLGLRLARRGYKVA